MSADATPAGAPVVRIGDADDPRLEEYARLTDLALRRRKEPAEGLYIAESHKVIRRALAAGHRPRSLLMAPRWLEESVDLVEAAAAHGAPVLVAEEAVLRELTGFHLHRGALASMHRPALPTVEEVTAGARRIAIFDGIVDHTNLGAGFRSAAALGVDAVLVTPTSADPLYRRSVRVSMGTVLQVPWTRIDDWPGEVDRLRAQGFTTAAMALDADSITLDQLAEREHPRLALIFGSEGHGLPQATLDRVDAVVRIPMGAGVDSLNVAASAAVAFWATR